MPNLSNTPDKLDEMFHGLMQAHQKLISQMAQQTKIPLDAGAFLDEFLSTPGPTTTFQLQVDRPVLVQFILFGYTPIGAATLTIGPASGMTRTIPIPGTTTAIPGVLPCAMVVKPSDILTLTCTGATATFLEIMGKVFSGTDWSLV